MTTRGKVMAPLVMAWRKGRGQKGIAKKALAELCRLVDHYAAEDVAAGRPAPGVYVEGLLNSFHPRRLDR